MGVAAPELRWEPELLGRVVADELGRLAARSQPGLLARYRAAAEPLYSLPLGEREGAFYELDCDIAAKLELNSLPLAELERAKWQAGCIEEVLLGPASVPNEEGADLAPQRKSRVVLRVRASRFGDRQSLSAFFAHEFAHIADLIDPAFGYSGNRSLPTVGSSEHLIRNRYRALWCASIDLRRKGVPAAVREARVRAVLKAFGIHGTDSDTAPVGTWLAKPLSHALLLSCAEDSQNFVEACPDLRGTPDAARTRCPVCRLPAFPSCSPADDLAPAIQAAVIADVPGWSPGDGMCERCREIYVLSGVLT